MQHDKSYSTMLKKRRPVNPVGNKHHFIDAFIINQPDFTVFFKLQNLINFFVDRMNLITGTSDPFISDLQHLDLCIFHIDHLFTNDSSLLGDDLARMLREFLSDASTFCHHAADTHTSEINAPYDPIKLISLTVEASHLQWLSVCILQEIKQALSS